MHPPANDPRQALGDWGESQAACYLQKQGLQVWGRHFQTRWGEVDLICRDRGAWVFVEVKTRAYAWQPSAADAITPAKRRRLMNAALSFMKRRRLEGQCVRFDVVLIEGDELQWIPSAFEADGRFTF